MANHSSFGGTCFEVSRTPPDIQKKRQREEARKCQEEIAVLTLVPFAEQPIVSFENIKLGQSSVRKLAIRNPSSKSIQINLDKLPKKEKGFEFEYVDFILGPEEEAIVQIGWVPSNGTPLREIILAKFGKHHAQIKLIATCKAPMDKKKAYYPRPPLRMANPRVTQKRVGGNNKTEEPKSSVPIPSNPITRQPNGTKPPWNFIGKENQDAFGHDSDDLAPQTLEPNGTNQIVETITKQHEIVTNVEDYMSPVKDRTGHMNQLSSNTFFTPDRRQTFVKNAFVPMKSNELKNMIAFSQEILPSTPERRMTYVKNSNVPIKSQTPEILNSSQLPDDDKENRCYALQETPISDQKIDTPCVDQKLVDTPLMNEAMKNNLNLSLEIAADCLLLTPDTTRARDYLSKCSKVDVTQQVLKSSSFNVEQEQEDILSDVKERGSFSSLEKEEDHKDSSKDTYVVDEPTIASLDDITEEGSLHDTTNENRMDSLRLSPYCTLSDTNDDIAQTKRTEYSVPNRLIIVAQAHENNLEISEKSQNKANSIKELLPEVQEDREKSLHGPTENNDIDSLQLSAFCQLNDKDCFITQTELSEYSTSNKLITYHEAHDNVSKLSDKSEKREFCSNNIPLPVTLEDRHQDETVDDISLLIANNVRLSRERNSNSLQPPMEDLARVEDTFTRVQPEVSRSERELSVDLSLQTIVKIDVCKDEVDQTIMETNQDVQRTSFLMDTVVEENFIPPNPGSSKYCSTAFKKDRTRAESQEFSSSAMPEKEKSSEIVRTLFAKNSKNDIKAKVSLLDKMNENKPGQNEKELASETWVIPVGQENEIKSGHAGDIRGNNFQPKSKPATNLKNRISLNPTISSSRSTNKSMNYSKLLTKSKPVNPRLTLIKPMKNRDTICHPNPHAAQNMYYDERWIEKQENGFKKWLNFVLTPPEGFDEADSQSELLRNGKLDVAKLWSACTKDVKVPRAPTREVLSLRAYTVQREMNRLRRNACTLLQSPDVANVLAKLEYEIEKHRFEMRKDKAIHKDVGMKKKFLILILNYNPLWLRIGLETVFGRIIPMSEAADYVTISKFIIRDFLNNPDILSMFAHPTVPHHYSEGYEIKLKQFILKKFFNLVLFLDQAKKFKMIRHNPCLFNKDSPIKMSRDMITSFSRDFLAGEGDVIKHLGYLGFKVDHKQTHLDEFDFAVTNIAVDVRCGVRLCRLMEILTKNQKITESLRLPASTRMQKLHNVGVALKVLEKSAAGPPPEKPTAKDIVDGHLQKTLDLLWHVIFGFQIGQLLNIEHLTNEIAYLEKTLTHEVRIGNENAKLGWNFYLDCKRRALKENNDNGYPKGWLGNERIMLLLKWAQLVCAHYGLEIENLSVSFSDGRGLCLLVHHYHPNFLRMEEIRFETTQTQQGNSNGPKNMNGSFNDSFGQTMTYTYAKSSDYAGTFDKLLKNEKENFKLMHSKTKELGGIPILIKSDEMSNTIPDHKVTATFITYLAARLLDLSVEMKAARTIQLAWKRFMAIKREEIMKVKHDAARRIQKCFRKFMRKQNLLRFEKAAVTIQTAVRRYLARAIVRNLKETLILEKQIKAIIVLQRFWRYQSKALQFRRVQENAALKCQTIFRGYIQRKKYITLKETVLKIQANWRTRTCYKCFQKKKSSTLTIQKWIRGYLVRKAIKLYHSSAVTIQKTWKKYLWKKHTKATSAAITLQSYFRMLGARKTYLNARSRNKAAICIQANWRRSKAIQIKKEKLHCISIIQARVKGFIARQHFVKLKSSALVIQSSWKTIKAIQNLKRQKEACLTVQRYWRGYTDRKSFKTKRNAIVTLQKNIKRHLAEKEKRRKLIAVVNLQKHFRRVIATKRRDDQKFKIVLLQSYIRAIIKRREYLRKKNAAIKIQSAWRKKMSATACERLISSVILIQNSWRRYINRKRYQTYKKAALSIQKNWRRYQAQLQKRIKLEKVVMLQSLARCCVQRKKFLTLKHSSIKIQSSWKGTVQFKRYQQLKKSTTFIQKFVRGWLVRKEIKRRQSAAILIQTKFRDYLQIKKYKQDRAANVIQAFFKMLSAKNSYNRHKRRVAAAVIIQKYSRRLLAMNFRQKYLRNVIIVQSYIRQRICRKRFLQMQYAAIKIQSSWRKELAVRKYKRSKDSAIVIQKSWKCFVNKRKYNQYKKAAITLQAHWKRRQAQNEKSLKLTQIIILQSLFRSRIQRKRYLSTKHAAVMAQSLWKRKVEQRKYQKIKSSTVILQKYVRGMLVKNALNDKHKAASKIQAAFKKFLIAKDAKRNRAANILQLYFKTLLERKRYFTHQRRLRGAIVIQKYCRGYIARMYKKKMIEKAVIIQSVVRTYLFRKKYITLKESAVRLQSLWRTKICVERYRRQKSSALFIQKVWRMYVARKIYKLQKASATTIQSAIRRFLAIKNKEHQYTAIIVIQKYFRRHLVKKQVEKYNWAAIILQKTWRMNVALKTRRYKIQQIIILQAHFRRYLQTKTIMKETEAAIRIQSFWRAKMAQQNYRKIKQSVIIIQKNWKAKVATKRYKRILYSIAMIQKTVKCYLKQQAYRKQKQSSISIQRYWRGYCAMLKERNHFLVMKKNVIKIQALLRAKVQLKRFNKEKHSALLIQRCVRSYLAQKKYKICLRSTITLQTYWRRHLAHMERKRRSNAVLVLQHFAKGALQRQNFLKMKAAALILQSNWRKSLVKNKHKKMIFSATLIQKIYRGYIQRRKYLDEKHHLKKLLLERKLILEENAACMIQNFMRLCSIRLKYKRIIRSTTIIQSYWRGYRQRKIRETWSNRIEEIRINIQKAKEAATEEKKLYHRTMLALDFLYSTKDMAYLIKVTRDLEFATRYSQTCCTRLIENNGLAMLVLANLAERCNRSLPHMEVVSTICDIFINISELLETRNFVASWDRLDSILKIIFLLMNRFKENKKPLYIFSKCCSFLWKLCQQENVLMIFKTNNYTDKLISFEKNAKGTLNTLSKTTSGTSLPTYSNFRGRSSSVPSSAKKFTKSSHKKLAMRHGAAELSSNIVRFFDDYQTAITSLNKEVKRCSSILE